MGQVRINHGIERGAIKNLENALRESSKPYERVMVFIDGGYLRECSKSVYDNDKIDFNSLHSHFINSYVSLGFHPFQANIIRIYYYDAIVENDHPNYLTQRAYFMKIDEYDKYTVRLGKLVESSKRGLKQKGVDILFAIDSLTKAYRNQFDTGMFLMGDADFIPLIEAIKDTGKKTMLIYYRQNTSEELIRCFDRRKAFDDNDIALWL